MKKCSIILICILLLLRSTHTFSQTQELLKRIDVYNNALRLEHEMKYDSLIALAQKQPRYDTLTLYTINDISARAYLHKGDTVHGFEYLGMAIQNQEYLSADNMKYSFREFKLDSNSTFKTYLAAYDRLNNTYTKNLDLLVLQDCLEIFYTDVRIRSIWMFQKDSALINCADKLMFASDTMNIANIEKLLDRIERYPGISDIGKSFTNIFNYIITHFASMLLKDRLYAYLKQATLKGQIPNWYAPRMLDKLEYDKGKPLIYGAFTINVYYKGDTLIYPEIVDINNVDKRRAEFLLPPLNEEARSKLCVLPKSYDVKRQVK